MRLVIQRVTGATCEVDDRMVSQIGEGLVLFVGIAEDDKQEHVEKIVEKVLGLRIFGDEEGKMDRSIRDVEGELLVIPNFTLCADVSKGRRPSFDSAASPGKAEKLYETIVDQFSQSPLKTKSGEFGSMMRVDVANDGPVTIILDSNRI